MKARRFLIRVNLHPQDSLQSQNSSHSSFSRTGLPSVAVQFYVGGGGGGGGGNRQRLKPLPESRKGAEAHRPDELAAAAVDCHKCCK